MSSELSAIGAVVGEARKKAGVTDPLRIASVKSNIGYTSRDLNKPPSATHTCYEQYYMYYLYLIYTSPTLGVAPPLVWSSRHAEMAAGLFSIVKVRHPSTCTHHHAHPTARSAIISPPPCPSSPSPPPLFAPKVLEMFRHRAFLPTAGVTLPRQDFDWGGQHMIVQQDTTPFPPLDKIDTPITVGVRPDH